MKESIAQRIHLILVSDFGEFRFNLSFGNAIWETDFENISNENSWKDRMSTNIKDSLVMFEPRLQNIIVDIKVLQEEFSEGKEVVIKRIKRKLEINVLGNLVKTNEQFYYRDVIYISPISLD